MEDRDAGTGGELRETLRQLHWILRGCEWSGVHGWAKGGGPGEKPSPSSRARGSAATSKTEQGTPPGRPGGEAERKEAPRESLEDIREDLGECTRCRLHRERNRIVFGEGSPRAPLVFVGEGPGREEDLQGRPFVGRAGKLLDKIVGSLGLTRKEVYICNVVKCRPPGNRTPEKDEIAACSPFMRRQVEAIKPKVVCALGAPAAQTLLGSADSISKLRGRIHLWRGVPLVATYHPAYLLRTPSRKADVWKDMLLVLDLLRS